MKRTSFIVCILLLVISACQNPKVSANIDVDPTGSPAKPSSTADAWHTLFEHTPVPWTTPLPPQEPTILDAT
ncbi:MAG: hypothetical protein ACXW4M_13580, partial [Anaerolineales bacterium]